MYIFALGDEGCSPLPPLANGYITYQKNFYSWGNPATVEANGRYPELTYASSTCDIGYSRKGNGGGWICRNGLWDSGAVSESGVVCAGMKINAIWKTVCVQKS